MLIHFIDIFFFATAPGHCIILYTYIAWKNLNRLLQLSAYYSIKNIVIILIALCRYNIAQRDNVYYYYVYIPAYYRGAAIPQGAVSRHRYIPILQLMHYTLLDYDTAPYLLYFIIIFFLFCFFCVTISYCHTKDNTLTTSQKHNIPITPQFTHLGGQRVILLLHRTI